jgi:hypothetical protein
MQCADAGAAVKPPLLNPGRWLESARRDNPMAMAFTEAKSQFLSGACGLKS